MLLPITDGIGGAIGFKVFTLVEEYLKNSTWCYYKYNSEILTILKNYKKNLQLHLRNPDVLKVVANKVNAGSIIRIGLVNQLKGVGLQMEVLGSNGKDLYFKERGHATGESAAEIANMVQNWLDQYEKTIPYDARVLSVLGNQFTLDMGKESKVKIGQQIVVKRPMLKREHPLLKEIVEWESEVIGKGEVFSVSESQASGVLKQYYSAKKMKKGDWVRIDDKSSFEKVRDAEFPRLKEYEFGKLGSIGVLLAMGKGDISNLFGGTNRRIGGFNVGLFLDATIWATRNWFGHIEIGRLFGNYEGKTNATNTSNNTVTKGIYKFAGGYKFLPLGFFYGPQIDVYGGFGRYSINADTTGNEGFGEWSIKGILLGVNGDAPIYKNYRLYLSFDLIPFGTYSEDAVIFGSSDDSARVFDLEFGSTYLWSPQVMLRLGFNIVTAKATFSKTGNSEVHSRDLSLKAGAHFTF